MSELSKYLKAEKRFVAFLTTLSFKTWLDVRLPATIPGVDQILKDLGGGSKLGDIRFGIETKHDGKYWTKGQKFYGTAKCYQEARSKAQKVFTELCWYRKFQSEGS
jgi:hypothetical protein